MDIWSDTDISMILSITESDTLLCHGNKKILVSKEKYDK